MEGEGQAIISKDVVHHCLSYSCSGVLFERLGVHAFGVRVNEVDNVSVVLMCGEGAIAGGHGVF